MELVTCTCWAVATMRIQLAPITPSIPGWTVNRKEPDKDANTDTSSTRSRTPSCPCAEKVRKCGQSSFLTVINEMFSASRFKESGRQPRRGVHDVCHQMPLWRVCPPHQRSRHHTHLHYRPGPGQGQGRHFLPEVQQLEKHQQVYSECRKSSFIIVVWCRYFIFKFQWL